MKPIEDNTHVRRHLRRRNPTMRYSMLVFQTVAGEKCKGSVKSRTPMFWEFAIQDTLERDGECRKCQSRESSLRTFTFNPPAKAISWCPVLRVLSPLPNPVSPASLEGLCTESSAGAKTSRTTAPQPNPTPRARAACGTICDDNPLWQA